MAIYLLCNTRAAPYTARLHYLLLGGWATGQACKQYALKDVMNTAFNAFTREHPKPTRAADYVEFPTTAQEKLVKERADNMLARDILIWHRKAYFILIRMIVDVFLPATHWQEVDNRLNNTPDQKPNEPHATFCNRVLNMARISNNLALAPYSNLLNLWYVMGPIKVENPKHNEFLEPTDANYEPEFLHAEECLD